MDFSNSINYHHLNNFAKTLDSKKKHISIKKHHSLGASSKQLTHFFDVQKTLSFSLENNIVNTYIYSNNRKLVRLEPISSPLAYNVTFSEFDEIDSLNHKNNYSTSSQSSYTSDNLLFNLSFNSLPVLTEIKNPLTPLFSVSSPQESEQHLYSLNVFPLLLLFISQPLTVDSPTDSSIDTFENLLFYFVYGCSFFFFLFFSK
jgi:hypothetical protein